jgi:glutathione S-transferase
MYTITIGDKAYSSWSLRGWLMLAAFRIRFEEEPVPMYSPDFTLMQANRAPARTVPQLSWKERGATVRVWDSAAILETLAERHPEAGHYPRDAGWRRIARILVGEMHSGFAALRAHAPMNLHRVGRPLAEEPEALRLDVERVEALWAWAMAETGGPWLAGDAFSAADAFYAPVVFRFEAYGLGSAASQGWRDRVAGHEAVRRWVEAARADPRRIARYDEMP